MIVRYMNSVIYAPKQSPCIDPLVKALKDNRLSITIEGVYYTLVVDGAKLGLHTYRSKRIKVVSDRKPLEVTCDTVKFDTFSIPLKRKIIDSAVRKYIETSISAHSRF